MKITQKAEIVVSWPLHKGPARMSLVKIERVIDLISKIKDRTSGQLCRNGYDDG